MSLQRIDLPHNWELIDEIVMASGGVIVNNLLSASMVELLNNQTNEYISKHNNIGLPETSSETYNTFLGHRTIRLHGLIQKIPATADVIADDRIVNWATRCMSQCASSVQLSAAELIQINPNEPQQLLHRDSDSWPLEVKQVPIVVNAIIALHDFTEENGATVVVPDSWAWDKKRRAQQSEQLQAVMSPGDALLFRGDLIHGGGENRSQIPRRALSLSYCAGWLRPVENSHLNLPVERVKNLPEKLQDLLGFKAHDGSSLGAGMVGLYENGDPKHYFAEPKGE